MGEEGAGQLSTRGQVREVTQRSSYANHYPGDSPERSAPSDLASAHVSSDLRLVGPFLVLMLGLGH